MTQREREKERPTILILLSPQGMLVDVQPEEVKAMDRDEGIMAPVFYSFSRGEATVRLFRRFITVIQKLQLLLLQLPQLLSYPFIL